MIYVPLWFLTLGRGPWLESWGQYHHPEWREREGERGERRGRKGCRNQAEIGKHDIVMVYSTVCVCINEYIMWWPYLPMWRDLHAYGGQSPTACTSPLCSQLIYMRNGRMTVWSMISFAEDHISCEEEGCKTCINLEWLNWEVAEWGYERMEGSIVWCNRVAEMNAW